MGGGWREGGRKGEGVSHSVTGSILWRVFALDTKSLSWFGAENLCRSAGSLFHGRHVLWDVKSGLVVHVSVDSMDSLGVTSEGCRIPEMRGWWLGRGLKAERKVSRRDALVLTLWK